MENNELVKHLKEKVNVINSISSDLSILHKILKSP